MYQFPKKFKKIVFEFKILIKVLVAFTLIPEPHYFSALNQMIFILSKILCAIDGFSLYFNERILRMNYTTEFLDSDNTRTSPDERSINQWQLMKKNSHRQLYK